MRFPLVLFDLDGTLVDSLPDIGQALNRALAEIGRAPLPLPIVRTLIGEGVMRLAYKALAATASGEPDPTAARALGERTRAVYREHPCQHSAIYAGMHATLSALRAGPGRRLAVITNKPGEVTRPLLEALGLTPQFDAVLGDGEGHPPKPDPAGARALMDRFGVNASDTLIVGDGVPDVQLGHALGACVAAVTWGYNDRAVLAALRPDHVIDRPEQLLDIA